MRSRNGKDVNCQICGETFYVTPSRATNTTHTCSKKCGGILSSKLHSQKIEVPCIICDKPIFYKKSHFKKISKPTCSMECSGKRASLNYSGQGNPKFLIGLSEEDRIFRDRESNVRVRANAKGMVFDIDYHFLKELYYKQNGKCAYSGLPMKLIGKQNKVDESFSVDRKDSTEGYTKDNVVLCLNIMNRFKGNATMEFFDEVCKGIANKARSVKIKLTHPSAVVPKYQTSGASGFDFHSIEELVLMPGETKIVRTGLTFQFPEGLELQIRPRSGISAKTKVRVANSPGTIDQDFTGEVKIILDNNGTMPYTINIGDRIAQGVICPIIKVEFEEVEDVSETDRGEGAFGSSGV